MSPNKLNAIPDMPNVNFTLRELGVTIDKCEDNYHEMYKVKNE